MLQKKKKKQIGSIIFLSTLLPSIFCGFPSLTSCSVSTVMIQPNNSDFLIEPNTPIKFWCDFLGINPSSFKWRIEAGNYYNPEFLDLTDKTEEIVGNSIKVTIKFANDILQKIGDKLAYFDFSVVFYNDDNSIVKRTETIHCYRNLKSPYLVDNFSTSLNEKIELDSQYFYKPEEHQTNPNPNPFDAMDFLDADGPDANGDYKFEDFRRIKQIFHSDLNLFVFLFVNNYSRLDFDEAGEFDIQITSLTTKINYMYDIINKNFIYLSLSIDFTGQLEYPPMPFVKMKGHADFLLHDYEIFGVTQLKNATHHLMDDKRLMNGNFLSIVPYGIESFYAFNYDVDVPIAKPFIKDPLSASSLFFMNGPGVLAISHDHGNAGLYLPCYNLDGKEYADEYLSRAHLTEQDSNRIEKKLLLKTITPYSLDSLWNNDPFVFNLKNPVAGKKYECMELFNGIPQKQEFFDLVSPLENDCWKKITIIKKTGATSIELPYWKYLGRIYFDYTNPNQRVIKINLNPCFIWKGEYEFWR